MEQLLRRLLQSLGGAGHYGDGFIIPAYKHIAVFSFSSLLEGLNVDFSYLIVVLLSLE